MWLKVFLVLGTIIYVGECATVEKNEENLVINLLKEVDQMKNDQVKIREEFKTQLAETNHKYDKLNIELLDLKREQKQWRAMRKEMEKTAKKCKIQFDKLTGNRNHHHLDKFTQSESKYQYLRTNFKSVDLNNSNIGNLTTENTIIHKRNVDPTTKRRLKYPSAFTHSTSNNQVAFYADLTSTVSNLGRLQIVVFDRVMTNVGNAYNKFVGIFTAPLSGIYIFSWYAMAYSTNHQKLDIVVDGQIFASSYSSSQHAESAGKTVIIDVTQGSSVWIRTDDNIGTGSIAGDYYTSFAGWLLYPKVQ